MAEDVGGHIRTVHSRRHVVESDAIRRSEERDSSEFSHNQNTLVMNKLIH